VPGAARFSFAEIPGRNPVNAASAIVRQAAIPVAGGVTRNPCAA
jgi:hypothetical protein